MAESEELDINTIIARGFISDEIELERASIAERKLRLLSRSDPFSKEKRIILRRLISTYEAQHWGDRKKITKEQIDQSDAAEIFAENESKFFKTRKRLIKSKLQLLEINQQELGVILGHKSKSYMSELMNGVVPFTLRDLTVISKLLRIKIDQLIPNQLSAKDIDHIEASVKKLNKSGLRFNRKDTSLV